MNLNQMLADQTQRDHAAAIRRPRRTGRPPSRERTIRHAFWHDRLVVTVSLRPAATAR